MKNYLFYFLFTFSFFYSGQLCAQTDLIVELKNAPAITCHISINGSISFSDHNILINEGNGNTITYPLEQIQKLYFDYFTGINSVSMDYPDILIYPNPTTDYLQISSVSQISLYFSIYAIDGRQLKGGKIPDDLRIDVSDLKSGIYILAINNKFIKFCKK